MSGKRYERVTDPLSKKVKKDQCHSAGVVVLLGLVLMVAAPAHAQPDGGMSGDRPCGQYNSFPWSCMADPETKGFGSAPSPVESTKRCPTCPTESCNCMAGAGNPVDLWIGREFFTHTDLVLSGLMDIVIRRSYDSQTGYDSALGYGWALSYFMRLYEYADGSVILRRDCGLRRSFYYEAGAYQTPVGETGTLVKNLDETWTYTEKSGDRFELDTDGKLTAIVSVHGPSLAFEYDSRGKLPLIGLSPYAVEPESTLEVAREFRLIGIDEKDGSGQPTGRWVDLTYDEGTGRLTTVSDSAGRTVQYVHDDVGNLEQVVLPENEIQTYLYEDPNDPHNATTMNHRGCSSCGMGTTVNTYDSEDRVIRQERGLHVLTFSYDIAYIETSYTEETTDEQGVLLHTATRRLEFNELGNPVLEEDPLGNQTVYVRDSRMNITRKEIWEEQGGPGLVLVYAEEKIYDSQDNVLTYTEAEGFPEERTTAYTYDLYGRLETITVPSVVDPQQNKVTTFTYDGGSNLLSRSEQGFLGDGSPFTYTTTYTYNGNGQVLTIDGPRTDVADVTTYAYDPQGNLTSVTQPLNLVTTYSDYTASGQPQTVTDPNGIPTTYTYDSLGRVTAVTVDGDTTAYTYTTSGKIEQITLPRQNAVTYSYESRDRLETITDGLGNTINYTYDSSGNRLKEDIKDPQGVLTKSISYQYDVLGRLTRAVNPDSSYTEYGYFGIGRSLFFKDPNGSRTDYQSDTLNRLTTAIQPGNITTSYTYDSQSNLIGVTDGNVNTTSYYFDDMGRLYQEVSPDKGTTTYEYDPSGNNISKTDSRGITVSYQYDALNRNVLVDYPSDTDIIYTYESCLNGKGRLCQIQDGSGTTTYSYTVKGQVVQEDRLMLGVNYTTNHSYDDNGNAATVTYPSGRLVTYAYDLADHIDVVTTTPLGGAQQTVASGITYVPFGNVGSLTYGNGLSRAIGYDLQYRIAGIQTGSLQNVSLSHDDNGNVATITDNLNVANSKSFSYDGLNNLTGATGPWGNLSWTYDSVGNRLTYTDGSGATNYSYQASTNRLAGLSGVSSATFTYDANGNTQSQGTRDYVYDEDDRLTQVIDGTGIGDYVYSAQGQRVVKESQGVTTVFHHDARGALISESRGLIFEDYIYANGQPIAKASGSEIWFIHTDHAGTPAIMTDGTGTSVWSVDYRPFGDDETISGSSELNLRFPGQYFDDETGLRQNGWRDYDSVIGRYLEPDKIGLRGGINPYVLLRFSPNGRS